MRKFQMAFGLIFVLAGMSFGQAPQVDDDVLRAFEREPDTAQPLILTVELIRDPIDIRTLLPSTEDYNACTDAWLVWQELAERRNNGEDVADQVVEDARLYAELLDSTLRDMQEIASESYASDYHEVVVASVPAVLRRLRQEFGPDQVHWHSTRSQFLSMDASEDQLARIHGILGLKRISLDTLFMPAIDTSRLSIRADEVHAGIGGVGPYTGAGVKVAIVDNGYDESHARLPAVDSANKRDFSNSGGTGMECSPDGHGSRVAGVVFCQPGATDSYLGIAYEATPVNAKVSAKTSLPDCIDALGGSWISTILPGLKWALRPTSEDGADADVANFSRHGRAGDGDSTMASSITARNTDWLIYNYGSSITHSCGNEVMFPRVAPPSGAYNILSVGGFEDNDTETRADDVVWDGTSPGPTQDNRRKPDLCAPGHLITTTEQVNNGFTNPPNEVSGTSFAAPHVAGVVALLKEARPSLTPRQIHAILPNATDHFISPPTLTWDAKAGWGALDAYRSVQHRNLIRDDQLAENSSKYYFPFQPPAGEEVVFTVVWHRAMVDAANPVPDSPHDLDLYLEGKLPGGDWAPLTESATGETVPGLKTYNNVEQVRFFQADQGQPQYSFRVRVERPWGHDQLPFQDFTLASRRPFLGL